MQEKHRYPRKKTKKSDSTSYSKDKQETQVLQTLRTCLSLSPEKIKDAANMNTLNQEIAQLLQQTGIEKNDLSWTTQVVLILAILLISYLTTLVFRHLIMPAVRKITARTKATWDDYLFNDKMMTSFCRMIPPIIWYILLPFAFNDSSAYLLQILLKSV